MKKFIIAGLVVILAILSFFLFSEEKKATYYVGLAQFGSHPSLDNCAAGFKKGLENEGIKDGKNLKINFQNSNFDLGVANLIANIFVSENVDLAATIGTPVSQAVFAQTNEKNIPLVFIAVADPVSSKLVDGNVTGVSDAVLFEKQLESIKEILPDAKTIGVIYNTSEANASYSVEKLEGMVSKYNLKLVKKGISNSSEVPLAVESIINNVDCIINPYDNTIASAISTVVEMALKHKVPVIGTEIEQVKLGCAFANGIDYYELGIKSGEMAAEILKGKITAEEMNYVVMDDSKLYVNYEYLEKLGINLSKSLKKEAIDVKK